MSRVIVITSCTSRKANPPTGEAVAAEALYSGEQHRRLMRGIAAFRQSPKVIARGHTLDLWILSAGYGLIRGRKKIPPYDRTFAGASRSDLTARAQQLRIPASIRRVLGGRFDLALILLGTDYVRVAGVGENTCVRGPAAALCSAEAELRLRKVPGVRAVRVGVAETRRFGCGLVGLKGEIAGRMLARLGAEPQQIGNLGAEDFDVLGWASAVESDLQLTLAA